MRARASPTLFAPKMAQALALALYWSSGMEVAKQNMALARQDPQRNPLSKDLVYTRASAATAAPERKGKKLFGRWALYGPQGQPRSADIKQGTLQNCWFLAVLGSMAQQCPGMIDDAIRIHPQTGQVQVRLYGVNGPEPIQHVLKDMEKPVLIGEPCWVTVSKQDLLDNLRRGGGSRAEPGRPRRTHPIWPALFETALAKALTPQRSLAQRLVHGPAGLDEGYAHSGAQSSYAMATNILTGTEPKVFDFQTWGQTPGSTPAQRIDKVYELLGNALAQGCMVNAAVRNEENVNYTPERANIGIIQGRQDGLHGEHHYIVEAVHTDKDGKKCVRLRNPYDKHENTEEATFRDGDSVQHIAYADGRTALLKVTYGPFSVPLEQLHAAGTLSFQPDVGGGFFSWLPPKPEADADR
jgi:Calpain family cysteine protease